ncbi:ABC transporter permease [Microvirga flavescens]|uniref:ABC transporter permease n=1 Tax=Microvirga flavescens TaxID=2249811 RepID=UPI000DDB9F99|nr:ABC transporter permease [Microvirga flavescens]
MALVSRTGFRSGERGPIGFGALIRSFWDNRTLIGNLASRDIYSRFRGSIFGGAWTVLIPLIMMSSYAFVFSTVLGLRWQGQAGRELNYPLVIFSGLIIFTFFAEVIGRAPGIILEYATFVKKVPFPLETTVWIQIVVALFNLGLSFLIFLLFYFVFVGVPPITSLLAPLALLPLVLIVLGLGWLFAAAGVYLRDLRVVVPFITNLLMLLGPVFYSITLIPEKYRPLIYLNPVTAPIQNFRDLFFDGIVPSLSMWGLNLVIGVVIAWLGYAFFIRTRHGFADVL